MIDRFFLRAVKVCWVTLATCILLLAVLITTIKYTLPLADDYKSNIEEYVFDNFGAKISIGEIGASWQTSGPVVTLYDLSLEPSVKAPLDISIAETQLKVNFWQSLMQQRFVSESFVLDGVHSNINSEVFYQIRPNSGGSQLLDNLSHLFLSQLHAFKLVNSDLQVRHKNGKTQKYHIESLNWINSNNKHQANGSLYVDGFSNNSISFIADLYGNKRESIFGQVYFEASQMDVSPWLMQLIDEHVELSSTQANFKAWGEIKNGLVNDIQLDVYDTGLNWTLGKKNKYLGIKNTRLHWWKSDAAWVAFANDIKLHTETKEFDDFYLTLFADADHTSLDIGDAEIETVSQLFSLFSATKSLDFITQGKVAGNVDNLQLLWNKQQELAARFSMKDVVLLPQVVKNQAYLGLENVAVEGYWLDQKGYVEVSGTDGQLQTADTFSQPIKYDSFFVSAFYEANRTNTSILLPSFKLKNQEVDINVAAEYIIGEQDILSLYGEVKGPKQGSIHHYLPRHLIDEETYQYLSDGIQQGRGEFTQVAIYANPNEMLDEKQSQLLVRAQLKNGIFMFDPEWPHVEELDAELWVRSDNMRIYGQSGQFYGIGIDNDVIVDIPLSSDNSMLQVMFTPELIEFSKFHSLVENSPLKEDLGEVMEFVKLDGEATATINIAIPKYEGLDAVAQGTVVTFASKLELPDLNLTFTELDTVVNFKNEQIDIRTNSAKLFGLPVSFNVTGQQPGADYQLDAHLIADWKKEQIEHLYPTKMNQYFDGEFNTELLVKVNLEDEDYQYFVDGKTSLKNASYKIFSGLDKPMGSEGFIDISAVGDETGNHIDVSLNETAFFSGYVDNETVKFEQANLAIGTDDAPLPEQGFDIKLELEKVEFEPTLTFVVDLIDTINTQSDAVAQATTADSSHSIIDVPHHVYGSIQNLSILEQHWDGVSLDAKPDERGWLFSVGAKQTLTEVLVYDDLEKRGIDIQSKFLQIVVADDDEEKGEGDTDEPKPASPKPKPPKPTEPKIQSAELIRTLPPIQFFCESCTYNDKPLGHLELTAFSDGDDLIIDKATLQYKRNRVDLKGTWFGDEGEGRTQIAGKVYSRYFGDWLKEYDLDTGVKDSDAHVDLDLAWSSAPFLFGYETLNGTAKFKLGDGSLSEISDNSEKILRLFSLFSLDSLYRKLKLDFNDVFAKGLFYNDIKGDIVVKNGVAYTDNVRMDGVVGNMELQGYTNLNTDELDYNVTFIPKLTSSIGVLTWIAASNPIAIIGAFALDKIIEDAEVIAEVRLKVSGNISDPKVEEVKRFKKKVQMPNKEEIEKYKQSHPVGEPTQVEE